MKTNEDKIILSIETAIRGGSISIIRGSKQIDFWTGEGEVSKSDEVLHQISTLLRKNDVGKREIRFVAVSTGPGSFTGLRIGIALARGLGKSLDCPIKGISALEALTLKSDNAKFTLTAIPFSKNQICWQLFEAKKSAISSMQISTEEMFLRDVISGISQKSQINQKNFCLVLHEHFYNKLKDFFSEQSFYIKTEINLAKYIGLSIEENITKGASDKLLQKIIY